MFEMKHLGLPSPTPIWAEVTATDDWLDEPRGGAGRS